MDQAGDVHSVTRSNACVPLITAFKCFVYINIIKLFYWETYFFRNMPIMQPRVVHGIQCRNESEERTGVVLKKLLKSNSNKCLEIGGCHCGCDWVLYK